MKHYLKLIFLTVLIFSLLPINTIAVVDTEISKNIVYLEDGSYITVELAWIESRVANSRTGSKTYTHQASNGDINWKAVLRGTFSYTGDSATCITSTCDVTITDTNWYEISKVVGRSGSSAICDLTMGRKLLGIKIDEVSVDIKLTCDANGNLS